jgi:serine/threonine protein kinase
METRPQSRYLQRFLQETKTLPSTLNTFQHNAASLLSTEITPSFPLWAVILIVTCSVGLLALFVAHLLIDYRANKKLEAKLKEDIESPTKLNVQATIASSTQQATRKTTLVRRSNSRHNNNNHKALPVTNTHHTKVARKLSLSKINKDNKDNTDTTTPAVSSPINKQYSNKKFTLDPSVVAGDVTAMGWAPIPSWPTHSSTNDSDANTTTSMGYILPTIANNNSHPIGQIRRRGSTEESFVLSTSVQIPGRIRTTSSSTSSAATTTTHQAKQYPTPIRPGGTTVLEGARSISPNELFRPSTTNEPEHYYQTFTISEQEEEGGDGSDPSSSGSGAVSLSALRASPPTTITTAVVQPLLPSAEETAEEPFIILSSCEFESQVSLLDFLGAGGAGCVHLAVWRGQEVAVKTLHPSRLNQPHALNDFKREVQLVADLGRHPNIVRIIAACYEPPHACFIMELASNGSVWHLLHDLRLRPRYGELLKLAEQMCRVMIHCHREHSPPIVHRDLKTHNLLISGDGDLRVTDFGLAQRKWNTFLSGGRGVLGTASFMAPEAFTAGPTTEKVDVFSYAVCMWELVTGEMAWAEMDHCIQIAMAVGVSGERLPLPSCCPAPLEALISSCWHPDPEKRPSFDQVLKRIQDIRKVMGILKDATDGGDNGSRVTKSKPTSSYSTSTEVSTPVAAATTPAATTKSSGGKKKLLELPMSYSAPDSTNKKPNNNKTKNPFDVFDKDKQANLKMQYGYFFDSAAMN